MPRVCVSIGSNIERERNISIAITMLRERFTSLQASPVYESEPVGFQGARFYNLVTCFDTDESPDTVVDFLRMIEDQCGRDREAPRFSSRTVDLDLLLYGDLVSAKDSLSIPRPEILSEAYVLKPLVDVAGGLQHPVRKRSYADLWAKFQGERKLWTVSFDPLREPMSGEAQSNKGLYTPRPR